MAWTQSRIFDKTIADILNNVTAMDADTDALQEVALFDNTVTPDPAAVSASTAYGVGVWAAGGVVSGTSWPALGRPLVSVTSASTAGTYKFDAADTVSADANCTLTAYGCLVYDKTIVAPVSGQGWCFNSFGGVQSVTVGTFSIVWAAGGIWSLTL